MSTARDTKPLVATKPFVAEGTRAGLGFLSKAIWLVVPGLGFAVGGILRSKAVPGDLVLGPTLLWAGAAIFAIGLGSPILVNLLTNALPKPTQRVEFFSQEFDVVLEEGAARSIKYSEIQEVKTDSMILSVLVDDEVLEIPFLAFQTRWEMERAESLVRSKLPDASLKSLNVA